MKDLDRASIPRCANRIRAAGAVLGARKSLADAERTVCFAVPPLITVCDVTKMASATPAVTPFPFFLNEIRSVAAFTPIFMRGLKGGLKPT